MSINKGQLKKVKYITTKTIFSYRKKILNLQTGTEVRKAWYVDVMMVQKKCYEGWVTHRLNMSFVEWDLKIEMELKKI